LFLNSDSFLDGQCKYGDKCLYKHGDEDVPAEGEGDQNNQMNMPMPNMGQMDMNGANLNQQWPNQMMNPAQMQPGFDNNQHLFMQMMLANAI